MGGKGATEEFVVDLNTSLKNVKSEVAPISLVVVAGRDGPALDARAGDFTEVRNLCELMSKLCNEAKGFGAVRKVGIDDLGRFDATWIRYPLCPGSKWVEEKEWRADLTRRRLADHRAVRCALFLGMEVLEGGGIEPEDELNWREDGLGLSERGMGRFVGFLAQVVARKFEKFRRRARDDRFNPNFWFSR
jgi:hypothetical protein